MVKEAYYIEMMSRPWQDYVKDFKRDILARRIAITTACRDCDPLPRVADAGAVRVEGGFAVQVMHNGLRVLYGRYYGNWVNQIIADLRGVHEPQEEWVFHQVLQHIPAGGVMLEAGCYWGYYSMWFARSVAGARNYLVEPQVNQMKTAQRNFEINGLSADFTVGYFGDYPAQKKTIQESRLGGPLPRFDLASFMAAKGLERIDLLHADIQGHEEAMMRDAADLLAQGRIGYLFLSTHGQRHAGTREVLVGAGYRILAEHGVNESASADGLLVAQSPLLAPIPAIAISTVDGNFHSPAA